jgi:two-component system sensor histidine kinase KdpD
MLFDIWPVIISAIASAFIWDFFFIPPRFNLHVGTVEDRILLLMYFVIAMVSAVLTNKIRQVEKLSRKREEKANAVKLYDTLLNSLSHELRTPIATIIAATDNLQTGNTNLTAENKDQLINEIATASLRLNNQVENLLNMSRLESGSIKPKLDWCDIGDLVHGVVRKIEENKLSQKITININPNIPLAKTDKGLLEQIIYNLVNNACSYTPVNSTINISALVHADILQVIVEDNGQGFPEEEIKDVFDKFYRLKNSKPGGTGLGLSIVKGFTEALKGNVILENISPGGARFTIEIPCEMSSLNI